MGIPPFPLLVGIEGADTAILQPSFGAIPPVDGSYDIVIDTPTEFVLEATNPLGTSTATLNVTPTVPTAQLFAAPSDPFPGEPVTLSVVATGGLSASIEPEVGPIQPESQLVTVFPDTVTTYVPTVFDTLST